MEKGPNIHLFGEVSAEKKAPLQQKLDRDFSEQKLRFLSPRLRELVEQNEFVKTEQQVSLINFANEEINKLMVQAGVEPYTVSPNNYHVVPPSVTKELGETDETRAYADRPNQAIMIPEFWTGDSVLFGKIAFHETMHLKSYLGFQAYEKAGGTRFKDYRSGVTAISGEKRKAKGGQRFLFSGLNEAIVAQAEKKFIPTLLESPDLEKENEWYNSDEIQKLKKDLAFIKKIPEEEIYWLRKHDSHWCESTYPYYSSRQTLEYICDEIQARFNEEYQTSDGVYDEFQKASFTGHLLPIARLMEETFGKGSFEILGQMTPQDKSGIETLEKLKKMTSF